MLPGIGGEVESPSPSVDPPFRGVAPCEVGAVAGMASGTVPVVVEGGVLGGGGLRGAGLGVGGYGSW